MGNAFRAAKNFLQPRGSTPRLGHYTIPPPSIIFLLPQQQQQQKKKLVDDYDVVGGRMKVGITTTQHRLNFAETVACSSPIIIKKNIIRKEYGAQSEEYKNALTTLDK